VREDDHKERIYFRSAERVIHMNGSWYFVTREGEEGPYPSEKQAQIEISRFISAKTDLASFQRAREARHAKVRDLKFPKLDQRSRIRPSEPLLAKRKVYI